MDTPTPPLKRTIWRRMKWFWMDRGEWVVGLLVGLMLLATGYSFCGLQNRNALLDLAVRSQTERTELIQAHERDITARSADWANERSYFRANAEQKNEDIRQLTAILGRMGIDTTSAAKNATETNKALTGGKAEKDTGE